MTLFSSSIAETSSKKRLQSIKNEEEAFEWWANWEKALGLPYLCPTMPDHSTIRQITILFETLSVPPPYSHTYSFRLQFTPNSVQIAYELQYTDRDELNEEEIWEEGFSPDDNFYWEGELLLVWQDVLLKLWSKTQWVLPEKVSETTENIMVVTTTFTDEQQQALVPVPSDEWEYLLQELTQAVYEAAQRELPLQIRYREHLPNGVGIQLTFTVHFLDRVLEVVHQQGQQHRQYTQPWSEVRPLLAAVYQLDYDTKQANTQPPPHFGQYIDPGDGLWYQWKRAVTNPGKIDYLSQVTKRINVYLKK